MRTNHLRCLGAPRPNAIKWFSAAYILDLSGDEGWLSQATKIVSRDARKSSRNNLPAVTNLSKYHNSFAANTLSS